MKIQRIAPMMGALAVAMMAQSAMAGPSRISSVFTDSPSPGYITINGSDFNKPVVSLDSLGLLTVQGWTATQITVACPSSPCPEGDYLLTVSKEKEGKDKGYVGPDHWRDRASRSQIWGGSRICFYAVARRPSNGRRIRPSWVRRLATRWAGTFRFSCSVAQAPCKLSVKAAFLSDSGGNYAVWPRVLIHRTEYFDNSVENYCEYGDGVTNTNPFGLVSAQTPTSTPTYLQLGIGIGGTADCGLASGAADPSAPTQLIAQEINVPAGRYDVFSTFRFYPVP